MLGIALEHARRVHGVEQLESGSRALDLLGQRHARTDGPMAYLIEAPAASTLEAHFHGCPQFQLFVAGQARLGRFAVRAGSLHYADAFTPYGPIISHTKEGYAYLTLRPHWCYDVHWMPKAAPLLRGRRGRNIMIADPPEVAQGIMSLIKEPDGVGATSITLRPYERPTSLISPLSMEGGGYMVVMAGVINNPEGRYSALSCCWLDMADMERMQAGAEGARLIMMTFAHHAGRAPF